MAKVVKKIQEIDAEFPRKLNYLFKPHRYKVARGGRYGLKSWSFARALLILGSQKKLRILCTREIQDSIKDSVKQLLDDQIELLGLGSFYTSYYDRIDGLNGTLFRFTGLSTQTVHTLKSYEGYDICWVEEGQVISKRSWEILLPTIRKEGSEIWVSYNPDLDTDETHQRFTVHPPIDCVNIETNWRDAKELGWFTKEAEIERQTCKRDYPDEYENIWEGRCRSAVEGAIYFKQVAEMERQGRICNVPYDPLLKVHIVSDEGWADSTAIGLVQKHASEVRIIGYLQDHHQDWDHYSGVLREKRYNWGRWYLPHDGFAGNIKSSGKSSEDILKALGWDVAPKLEIETKKLSVEEGIKAARRLFPQIYIDKTNCGDLVEALKRYKRYLSKTGVSGGPVHDEYSHGADMLRYVAVNIDLMINERIKPKVRHPGIMRVPMDPQTQSHGWMKM